MGVKILRPLCYGLAGVLMVFSLVSPVRAAGESGITPGTPLIKPARGTVAFSARTVDPSNPVLVPGGSSVRVTLTGPGLEYVTEVQVLPKGHVSASIQEPREKRSSPDLVVSLTAGSDASAGTYTLRLVVGEQMVDIPASLASVLVRTTSVIPPRTAGLEVERAPSTARGQETGAFDQRTSQQTQMLSNVVKAQQDAGKSVVRNIRGDSPSEEAGDSAEQDAAGDSTGSGEVSGQKQDTASPGVTVSGSPVPKSSSGVVAGRTARSVSPERDIKSADLLAQRSGAVADRPGGSFPDSKPSGTVMIDTVPVPERPASTLPPSRLSYSNEVDSLKIDTVPLPEKPASRPSDIGKVDTLKIDTVPLPEKPSSGPRKFTPGTPLGEVGERAEIQPLRPPMASTDAGGAKQHAVTGPEPVTKHMDRMSLQQNKLVPTTLEALSGIAMRADQSGSCDIVDDPNMPIPRVTSWGPQRGYKGSEITFSGTNFVPDRFCVKFGSGYLEIISRSANQIVARLPEARQTGRLAVSHSTAQSEFELSGNYYVAGDPVITGITPETFITGDVVTVNGYDLIEYMFPQLSDNTVGSVVKISSDNTSDSAGDNRFLSAVYHAPQTYSYVNEEGNQAKFKVMGPLSMAPVTMDSGFTYLRFVPSDPAPSSLTGNMRFVGNDVTLTYVAYGGANRLVKNPSDTSSWFTFSGPDVTWNRSGFSFTGFSGPSWGDSTDNNFVIADGDPFNSRIQLYGTDLNGASVKVGGVNITNTFFNADGRSGYAVIPMATPSGIIELTKGGETARSTEPLIVIPEPEVMKPANVTETGGGWGLPLNQDIDLAGWDLLPGGAVAGLNYFFNIDSSSVAGCTEVQYVSHNSSHIIFRVNSIGDITDMCRNTTAFGGTTSRYLMTIVATYNGFERRLWQQEYYLVAP